MTKELNKIPDLLVCRACLTCSVPVYNILYTQYQNVFERIAVISLVEHGKPHALCAPCLETLHKFCRLQEKSKISEGILNRLLKQNKLTESAIKKVNRQHYNIADTLPNFTLELMIPNDERKRIEENDKKKRDKQPPRKSKLEEHSSPSLSFLPFNDRNACGLNSKFGIDTPERCQTQYEVSTDNIIVKIEADQMKTPEDLRDPKNTESPEDMAVKTEPIDMRNSEDTKDLMVEPGLTYYDETDAVVKTERMEMQDCFAVSDDAESESRVFAKEPPNETNHKISIETVKLKETPFIQIDAVKLQINMKSEVDSDEIDETYNVPESLDNDSLVEITQPIRAELSKITDDKNILKDQLQALKSSQCFIEECKVDGRRIKSVSSTQRKATKTQKEPKQTSKSYQCNKCNYQTPFKKRLMYHTKKHTGFVICAVCDYKCATKSRLVSHLRVHTKERPYKCKICNKGFSELGSLRKHKNMHNGVKPYKCMWCEYKAASKNHLDRHIKRHIGDKSFKCELCEYACVQKWDLKRHGKTHENERFRSYKRVAPVNPVIVETVSIAEK